MKYFAMRISSVDSIDFITLKNVLTSVNITDAQKVQFIRTNKSEISKIMEQNVTSEEFQSLMELRPLQKFKPIKNSSIIITACGNKSKATFTHVFNFRFGFIFPFLSYFCFKVLKFRRLFIPKFSEHNSKKNKVL